ncbi:MAG: hypothetical protein SWK76_07925 [Actinomycetota bacterium]|nr:hypothetical protein [Actinomycetota bacterium]
MAGDPPGDSNRVYEAIGEKVYSDLADLERVIKGCRRCPGGGSGLAGHGEPGSGLFLLAGRPGPGSAPGNPWGSRGEAVLERLGWYGDSSHGGIYFSTALRCPLDDVSAAELRRCAGYLAEELFLIGPRLVMVSGKLAVVTLRAALGEGIPGQPKAGDSCSLFFSRFLFNVDVGRIDTEGGAAKVFWNVFSKALEMLEQPS